VSQHRTTSPIRRNASHEDVPVPTVASTGREKRRTDNLGSLEALFRHDVKPSSVFGRGMIVRTRSRLDGCGFRGWLTRLLFGTVQKLLRGRCVVDFAADLPTEEGNTCPDDENAAQHQGKDSAETSDDQAGGLVEIFLVGIHCIDPNDWLMVRTSCPRPLAGGSPEAERNGLSGEKAIHSGRIVTHGEERATMTFNIDVAFAVVVGAGLVAFTVIVEWRSTCNVGVQEVG